jgi:succinate dehydrogenase / fumarate reductase membrane anchor subunit
MKEGAKHWLWVRVTAVALIPLSLWFLASIIAHSASDRGAFVDWLRTPTSSSLMILLLAALFYHISLGLQVIIEDYIHSPVRTVALAVMRVGCLVLVATGGFAVVCIALYS